MEHEEEESAGIPEWVVTFGDMMSLLLTFFIMLVSMSEIKEDERYQAMVDSMRQEFGHEASIWTTPGNELPRNSNMIHTASAGRARRRDTMSGGAKVEAVIGDNPRVHSPRTGKHASNVGIVQFPEWEATLGEQGKQQLQQAALQVIGKPQRVEIRGHASRRPLSPESTARDKWDLAYERCREVMRYLVEQGVDSERIHFRVSADNEPLYDGIEVEQQQANARVEIFMWDERIGSVE